VNHAELIMQAHQYLYYVLANPVWTDYEYDMFCKRNGLQGGGGSDCAKDYSAEAIAEAAKILGKAKQP
jgi:NAD-dependent DNA ligase